ncbi:putative bifunctional diguanylate cyclase/phosphodiesterase [uncultured Novosphingobium sp.]|uniref:putative bifunctional diguanylate cyclase/phosphodiesterase n=1 Tax=uncultured Novosphingobium sp. TaxID=292277 RepID=UPI00374A44CA
MLLIRPFLNRLGRSPVFRQDLIRHDVPARDGDWFIRSRVQQFARYPWLLADGLRGLISLALMITAPTAALVLTGVSLLVLMAGELVLRRTLATPLANPQSRLSQIQAFLLARGVAWALIVSVMVRYAGTDIGVTVALCVASLLFDLLFTLALPIAGVAAASLVIIGLSSGLVATPGTHAGIVLAMAALSIVALHYALFHLYNLFATRQLGARQLSVANDTIRSLLTQYDEHGADALVEVDREGLLVRPSQRLCELLGRTADELSGRPLSALFETGLDRSAFLGSVSRRQQFRHMLVPLRIRGERHWWSISGCPVFDADDQEEGFRCFVHDVTEQRVNEERIRIMAMRDNLTGLVNRAVFTERLGEVLARSSPEAMAGVLFIDLDSFKLVNDTYGHAAGDTVLIEAARRLEGLLGVRMVAARLGGDEFAVLAWNVTDSADMEVLGNAIVAELSRPVVRDDAILPCGASVGIALAPEHGRTGETVLRAADLALYEAKSRGRAISVMFHPQLLTELQERRELEMSLRVALERGELVMWYQPLLDIGTRRTVGYEALIRWNHPTRGIIEPSNFIPLAEEAGLIGAIGEWALREALAEAATWHDDLSIAVNVSPAQMRGDAVLKQVVSALAATGVAPERLELEITETLLMEDCEMHLRTLHRLRALGVRIALDDFGTGYSSLNYLRRFPFDKLKVDRSFVSDIVEETDSGAIVETVLNLARKFDMKTTAEGIESEAQLAKLDAMGCSQAQGFLFDKPLPAEGIPPEHRKSLRRLQIA